MDIQTLFETYEVLITNKLGSKKIFTNSGMLNTNKVLDFGFFPLGSGILADNKSPISKASIEDNGIMILGNDFGTVSYLETKCKNNKENSSKTITNLLGLGLNLDLNIITEHFYVPRWPRLDEFAMQLITLPEIPLDYNDPIYSTDRKSVV